MKAGICARNIKRRYNVTERHAIYRRHCRFMEGIYSPLFTVQRLLLGDFLSSFIIVVGLKIGLGESYKDKGSSGTQRHIEVRM
jgi:hypothetical protein